MYLKSENMIDITSISPLTDRKTLVRICYKTIPFILIKLTIENLDISNKNSNFVFYSDQSFWFYYFGIFCNKTWRVEATVYEKITMVKHNPINPVNASVHHLAVTAFCSSSLIAFANPVYLNKTAFIIFSWLAVS